MECNYLSEFTEWGKIGSNPTICDNSESIGFLILWSASLQSTAACL